MTASDEDKRSAKLRRQAWARGLRLVKHERKSALWALRRGRNNELLIDNLTLDEVEVFLAKKGPYS